MSVGALVILMAASAPPVARPDSALRHDEEIAAFASTMAIVRTFAETCGEALINEAYLEDLRQRLHVVEDDHTRFAEKARRVAQALKEGLAEAPSRRLWCDNLYALYGPTGTMIPNLLRRR